MENISHFLSFVSRPPVSLAAHDVFLTVDLFEQKDPAQVIQCLGAFSRVANKLDPIAFPTTIGGLRVPAAPGALSPQLSGGWSPGRRNVSGGSTGGGVANAYVQSAAAVGAPTLFGKPSVPPRKLGVSSWSRPTDERATAPAWNIAQYGYMGGASQGNQGVSFGARRQITNNPVVKSPTLEDNEVVGDSRRQQEEIQDRRRADDESRRMEEDQRRQETQDRRRADEESRRIEEDHRRQEEGRRHEDKRRTEEKLRQEARLRREEEEVKAALEIERRKRKEEKEEEGRKQLWQLEQDQERVRAREQLAIERREEEDRRVRDAEAQRKLDAEKSERERERERIRQLERELEKARERERIYEAEKEERRRQDTERMRRDAQEAVVRKHRTGDSAYGTRAATSERDSFSVRSHKTGDQERESMEAERRFLAGGWRGDLATPPSPAKTNTIFPQHTPDSPALPPRALPTPPPRKLPSAPTTPSRVGALPSSRYFTQDHLSEPMRRSASWETNDDGAAADKREEEKKQAYKWARCVTVLIPDPPNPLIPTAQEVEEWITDRARSMSLLERERERERERQREWESNQREMEEIRARGDGNYGGEGEDSWDINQYGYADDILDLY